MRIVAGSYVFAEEWHRLKPHEQHLVRVCEVADRAAGPLVLTHSAAAAIHIIDRIGRWPDQVEVRIPASTGGRSSGHIRRRALGFDDVELMEWRGHLVTTPAQTALDVASDSSFIDGVIALDQAQWRRRQGGPLVTRQDLWRHLDKQWRRGLAKVPEMMRFSTALSDSVRESEGRVLIERLGFPAPALQKEFRLPSGASVYTDYYFEDFDHVAEFDGTGKYFDPALRAGRTPREVLLEEKDREDQLRRQVTGMSRWRTAAHRDPRILYDILTGDGLPSRLPRPRPSAAL